MKEKLVIIIPEVRKPAQLAKVSFLIIASYTQLIEI
jgi:hypothetical protein